jgi:hypothetical protein
MKDEGEVYLRADPEVLEFHRKAEAYSSFVNQCIFEKSGESKNRVRLEIVEVL